jgi:tetratricopeptide (TPR) repeat protein
MAASVPSEERSELLMRACSLRSMALKSLRKPEDAVRAAERAVQEARAAARSGSEEARAWLPMEIMNLANRYSELGEHQQALEIIRQSVDLMREREQATLDPLSPNMADVLINYAQCLRDCAIIPEAREAVAEAVTRLCRLVRTHSKFVPKAELAADLWRTYLRSSDISNEQVRADYEQLIGLLGELSETGLAMGVERAEVMSEYAARLARAGDLPRARHWKAQAARVRNSASRGDPADPQ